MQPNLTMACRNITQPDLKTQAGPDLIQPTNTQPHQQTQLEHHPHSLLGHRSNIGIQAHQIMDILLVVQLSVHELSIFWDMIS